MQARIAGIKLIINHNFHVIWKLCPEVVANTINYWRCIDKQSPITGTVTLTSIREAEGNVYVEEYHVKASALENSKLPDLAETNIELLSFNKPAVLDSDAARYVEENEDYKKNYDRPAKSAANDPRMVARGKELKLNATTKQWLGVDAHTADDVATDVDFDQYILYLYAFEMVNKDTFANISIKLLSDWFSISSVEIIGGNSYYYMKYECWQEANQPKLYHQLKDLRWPKWLGVNKTRKTKTNKKNRNFGIGSRWAP